MRTYTVYGKVDHNGDVIETKRIAVDYDPPARHPAVVEHELHGVIDQIDELEDRIRAKRIERKHATSTFYAELIGKDIDTAERFLVHLRAVRERLESEL